ncbi:uncharacterized protein LOC124442408 [Xenia sp. Carnegie-2017]|uniref:uncharacterized protein LOC124442408 n=1 Tax=Xenia sp. Carnegie-2017 TaxID=2897299 RepID=UPI001F0347ED|nr:uncharacterized protein LOC124442408 [Xenia sp. Carnegie-2017]
MSDNKTAILANNQRYLALRNVFGRLTIIADGEPGSANEIEVQFIIDRGTNFNVIANGASNTIVRIRPASNNGKYIAVDGSSIVLKDVPNSLAINDSSFDFYEENVAGQFDTVRFVHRVSRSYLTLQRGTNQLVLQPPSSDRNAWMRLRNIENNISLFRAEITESVYVGEKLENELSSEISYEIFSNSEE